MDAPALFVLIAGPGQITRDRRVPDDEAPVRAEPRVPSDVSGPVTRFTGPEGPVPPANSGQPGRAT